MSEQLTQNDNRWDWIVRLCHWLMVGLIAGSWFTAENGFMQWHYYLGYALIAVITVRIAWGIIGKKPARFSNFLRSPVAVIRYLKNINQQKDQISPTHSPAGGYSVIALLGLMLTQTISGLFSVETDGYDGGPLSENIDYDLALQFSEFHQTSFDVLLGFIVLHIFAVVFYQKVLKQPLLQTMSPFKNRK